MRSISKQAVAVAAIAAGLAAATTAQAGVILQPKSVTVVTGGTAAGYSATDMINQSGLSKTYVSGVTDFDTYIASNPLHAFASGEWLSLEPATTAKITFDFGEIVEITGFAFWDEDSSSLRSMIMSTSLGGYAGTGLLTDNPFGQAYGPTVVNHQRIKSRYITFEMSGCNRATAVYKGCGMGEVIFESALAAPPPGGAVPEPATWAMMILGFAGTGAMVRRSRRSAASVA